MTANNEIPRLVRLTIEDNQQVYQNANIIDFICPSGRIKGGSKLFFMTESNSVQMEDNPMHVKESPEVVYELIQAAHRKHCENQRNQQ
jgi:hypothetical protein